MKQILDEVEHRSFVPLSFSDIEQYYDMLSLLGARIPNAELESVSTLFQRCDVFQKEVPALCHQLMTEQRKSFEQLLDTQLKTLLVSSIHLRDAFEEDGPLNPDLSAKEATLRLRDVEKSYRARCEQQNVCHRSNFSPCSYFVQTLQSVQALFGLPITQFNELDRLGKEITFLNRLYNLYEAFVDFNDDLREQAWSTVNLDFVATDVNEMLMKARALPSSLQGWIAYTRMSSTLSRYVEVYFLLVNFNFLMLCRTSRS